MIFTKKNFFFFFSFAFFFVIFFFVSFAFLVDILIYPTSNQVCFLSSNPHSFSKHHYTRPALAGLTSSYTTFHLHDQKSKITAERYFASGPSSRSLSTVTPPHL